jgi:hypothetical protein
MLLALHIGRMGSPLRSYVPGSGRAGGAYANVATPHQKFYLDVLMVETGSIGVATLLRLYCSKVDC